MRRLLIKNIRAIISCDGQDRVYEGANLFCEDGLIRSIGPETPEADEVIDGTGFLCYPGLVNAHHHLYQYFSRNLPQVQNLELFPWLTALYEIWKRLTEETVRLSSLVGMGELLKNGCTTVFDHHYVFPAGAGDLIGAQAAAAETLGVRMHFSRGSMDRSKRDGGLPPDSVVQSVDEIMRDSVDLISKYHDPSFASMRRLALAPCSPFSVSAELCGRAPFWRGNTRYGSIPICVKQRMRSVTRWKRLGYVRWLIWKRLAGSARTCGTRTGSILTIRS